MKFKAIVFFLLLCALAVTANAQNARRAGKGYRQVVEALSADTMRGRMAGTPYEQMAGAFVVARFAAAALKVDTQLFTYRINDTGELQTGTNCFAFIDNNADSTIVIGAHFDHLGMGDSHSRSFGKVAVHPGADDNASGVALLTALAHRHKKWTQKNYNYLLVGYAAHEVGLYGSAAFSSYCATHFRPVCLVLNFDMVGRMDKELKLVTIYSLPARTEIAMQASLNYHKGHIVTDEPEKTLQTDCRTFAQKGITSFSFTTGLHDDYHKISDIPARINYEGIWTIQQMVEYLLKNYPQCHHNISQ
jgi:Zn-dependent M28 family amino/carboxypeptidase